MLRSQLPPRVFARVALVLVLVIAVLAAACGESNPVAPNPPPLNVPFSTTDLVVGSGGEATTGRTVTITYDAWIYDADAVDNKGELIDQGFGFFFPLGTEEIVEGLNRGIEGMRVGGRRRIVTPPDLAFGDRTLVYEVDLLAVRDPVPFSTTDLVVGTGDPVTAGQTLTAAFTLWLYDPDEVDNKGDVLDESDGWSQGVEGMRLGGIRRIVVPPDLGFGAEGSEVVPSFATLIFEIELLEVG